jgi:hypothetical protein
MSSPRLRRESASSVPRTSSTATTLLCAATTPMPTRRLKDASAVTHNGSNHEAKVEEAGQITKTPETTKILEILNDESDKCLALVHINYWHLSIRHPADQPGYNVVHSNTSPGTQAAMDSSQHHTFGVRVCNHTPRLAFYRPHPRRFGEPCTEH